MISVVLYCYTVNDWESRLKKQINRLYTSGLYDNADEIYLIISDVENNKKLIVEELLVEFPKIKLEYHIINQYETLALIKVYDLCQNNDNCKVLYFHTKGVFNKYKNFVDMEIDELKVNSTKSWVEMMEYFLVDNWRKCVEKLDEYDTVGVCNNNNWWWGNFWWAKSSHVRKNVPITSFYGSRWSCESWLHESNSEIQNIKYFELNKFNYDPHYTIIPKYFYNGDDISNIKIDIIDAKFGYFSEQRDEGRGLIDTESYLIDMTDEIKKTVESVNYKRIFYDWSRDIQNEFIEKFNRVRWSSLPKSIRIKFRTNIDSENEYVVSSFNFYYLNIGFIE